MTLGYWREYRTLFHLGTTMGVSEGTASRRVRWVEDTLIGSGRFALPKRTARFAGGAPGPFRVVVVDATEPPVERPKKTAPVLQRQVQAPYREKRSADRSLQQTHPGYGHGAGTLP